MPVFGHCYFFITYLATLPRSANMILGTVLRAAGDTKTPMRIGIGVNVINLVLNYFLINPTRTVSLLGLKMTMPGAGMGVIGAAVASVISMIYGGVAMLISVFKHEEISPKGLPFKLDMEIMRPCLKTDFFFPLRAKIKLAPFPVPLQQIIQFFLFNIIYH